MPAALGGALFSVFGAAGIGGVTLISGTTPATVVGAAVLR